MKNLRTYWMAGLLLVVAGCGCGGDTVPGPITAPGGGFTMRARMFAPPVPVTPMNTRVRADVLFLLDDGWNMEGAPNRAKGIAGQIQNQIGAPRLKGEVAKQAVREIQTRLNASVAARLPGRNLDLAFGVARFEDYGGAFRTPAVEDDPTTPSNEALASVESRPFILNQPILREAHPDFGMRFEDALVRRAPGDGRRPLRFVAPAQDATEATGDAQSAFEALYQSATGAGFDGNRNGSTADSGVAGAVATQTAPGNSGDVPAPVYTAMGPDPSEPAESVFGVGDTISSGNVGGVGWRPDALRFIIVISDVCAVTPFPANFVGNPFDATKFIMNTANAPGTGPRLADQIANPALACSVGVFTEEQRRNDRFGKLEAPTPAALNPVAPPSAATAQMAITALNGLDIEVLAIGTPLGAGQNPGPFKPSGGSTSVTVGGDGVVIDAGMTTASPDPYKWMTAVARLTGARDPNGTNPGFTPENIPLVYDLGGNLSTVNPSLLPPTGTFNPVIVEDLTDRIELWQPFLPPPTTADGCVSIRWMFDLETPAPGTGIALANLDVSNNRVALPLYATGTTPPAAVFAEAIAVLTRIDPDSSDEIMATLNFVATPILEYVNPVGAVDPILALPKPVSGRITVVLPARPIDAPVPIGEFVLQPGSQGCFRIENFDNPGNAFTSSDCGTTDPSTAGPSTTICTEPVPTLTAVRAEFSGQPVGGIPAGKDPAMIESAGYSVVLSGTNFTDGSIVTIDGKEVPSADVVSISPTAVRVIPPRVDLVLPATSATVDVSVTTEFGTVTLPQSLTYGDVPGTL